MTKINAEDLSYQSLNEKLRENTGTFASMLS